LENRYPTAQCKCSVNQLLIITFAAINYAVIKLGITSWQKIRIDYRANSYRDMVDRAGRQLGARREVGWGENELADF